MEQQTTGRHIHVGMRIVKTVIAVFVCGLLAYARNESGFYSMIAAVMCVQNSTGKTVESSVNRMLGTLIGGVAGILVVYALDLLGILYIELARYAALALILIPIIEFCLVIRKPDCAAMACMVFLCVTVNHSAGDSPAIYSIQRLFETLVGVAVACAVNVLLPHHASAPVGPVQEEAAPVGNAQEKAPPAEDEPAGELEPLPEDEGVREELDEQPSVRAGEDERAQPLEREPEELCAGTEENRP